MKKLTAILLLLSILTAHAADVNKAKTILWEISGNGLEKPSYLFGSWHMLCRSQVIFKDKVKLAIADSKQLIFQNYFTYLSEEDYYDRQKTSQAMSQGVPIYKIDDRKKRKKILKLIDKHMDLKVNNLKRVMPLVKRMKPIDVFFSSLHSYIDGCYKLGSFDKMMYSHFKKKEYPIGGFGNRTEIWNAIQKSEFMSEDSLLSHLNRFDEQQAIVKEMMLAYYMEEDTDKLKTLYHQFLLNEFVDSEKLNQFVFNLDSSSWLKNIITFIQNDVTFVSVNAIYLNGEFGLIEQLKAKGYQLKPL